MDPSPRGEQATNDADRPARSPMTPGPPTGSVPGPSGSPDAEGARRPASASRSPGRPRDARVDTAVAEAVAELLAEVGYGALTIEGVAARAGVAKSTVYRRWAAKRELVADALAARARSSLRAPDTGSLRGDLIEHLRAVNAALAAPIGQAIVGLVAEARHEPELARALRQGFVASRRAEVGELLARAGARGEVRSDLAHDVMIDLIVSPLWYRTVVWGQSLDDATLVQLVDALVPALSPAAVR